MIDWSALVERKLHVENDGESHVERDAETFHPSQIARCPRQCVISKFGLSDHDTGTLGTFQVGTMIHAWLEEAYTGKIDGVEFEKGIRETYPDYGVQFIGHCDVYDAHESAVYDFKTRSGWYKFDPPKDRHLDQLAIYMDALDADHGQIVYVSKKDLEIRTWPGDRMWSPSQTRLNSLLKKAERIKAGLNESHQNPESPDDVPFDPCDCWLCGRETEGSN